MVSAHDVDCNYNPLVQSENSLIVVFLWSCNGQANQRWTQRS
jgi:hypothetical protein